MKILRSEFIVDQGYPILIIETDLGRMWINREQKMWPPYGLIYTGLEDELPAIELPDDPTIGRAALTLRGFTDDAEVVELFKKFLDWDGEG